MRLDLGQVSNEPHLRHGQVSGGKTARGARPKIEVKGLPQRSAPIGQICKCALAIGTRGAANRSASWDSPKVALDPDRRQGKPLSTYVYAAQAEVEGVRIGAAKADFGVAKPAAGKIRNGPSAAAPASVSIRDCRRGRSVERAESPT